MKKITKLTPEQEALLPVVRDEWLAHGLSTAPANRAEAEAGVAAAYRAAGLQPPRFIIWLGSPWAGAVGQAVAPEIVADGLRRLRCRQVYGQVYGQVDDQVGGQVGDQEFKNRLRDWWKGRIWGQHWAGYYSWLDAMERIGVTGLEPIHGQQQVAKNAGWWWCFRDFAIITDRPAELHRDQLGRLHCETGPAIRYRDGWGFYAWHGRRVPAWVVLKPTVEAIAAETNAEVRRCAIESMGWPQFIAAAELSPVDTCADPGNPGQDLELYDVDERLWGARVRVLVCTNGTVERDGTRRTFGLTVPTDLRRESGYPQALTAAAWGYKLTAARYAGAQVRR